MNYRRLAVPQKGEACIVMVGGYSFNEGKEVAQGNTFSDKPNVSKLFGLFVDQKLTVALIEPFAL